MTWQTSSFRFTGWANGDSCGWRLGTIFPMCQKLGIAWPMGALLHLKRRSCTAVEHFLIWISCCGRIKRLGQAAGAWQRQKYSQGRSRKSLRHWPYKAKKKIPLSPKLDIRFSRGVPSTSELKREKGQHQGSYPTVLSFVGGGHLLANHKAPYKSWSLFIYQQGSRSLS